MDISIQNRHEWLVLQPGRQPDSPAAGIGVAGRVLYGLGRSALRVYAWTRLDMDVDFHARLPDGPKILAVNHPSTTDPFYILTLLAEPVSVLVTDSAFAVSGFGWYLRRSGHLPCVRSSGGRTVDAVVRTVEAGRSVAIFPEGALSPLAGGFHRAHTGVARVALRTGAPVVPVGVGLQRDRIHVRDLELPNGVETSHLLLSGPYAMTIGRPLYYTGSAQDRERVRAVADDVMRHVRRLARESDRRVARSLARAGRRTSLAKAGNVGV